MDEKLKQRLVGAAVVISLGVIFLPMLLDGGRHTEFEKVRIQIPPVPEVNYESSIEPLSEAIKPALQKESSVKQTVVIQTEDKISPSEESASINELSQSAPDIKEDVAELIKPIEAPDEVVSKNGVSVTSKPEDETIQKKVEPKIPPVKVTEKKKEKTVQPVTKVKLPEPAPVSAWVIQVGSFSNRENAIELRDKLRKNGFTSFVESFDNAGKPSHRVRIGPETSRSRAEASLAQLSKKLSMKGIIVSYP